MAVYCNENGLIVEDKGNCLESVKPVYPELPELKAEEIRYERNMLLSASDWTQMPDNVLSPEKKEQWISYRQSLRDIPQQFDFPENVTWPEKPE